MTKLRLFLVTFAFLLMSCRSASDTSQILSGAPVPEGPTDTKGDTQVKGDDANSKALADRVGFAAQDLQRLQDFARQNQEAIIMRTSNPASTPFRGQPGYRAKPHDALLKTARDGAANAGLVVKPENPQGWETDNIKQLMDKGWSFDQSGLLRDPNGAAVYSDYDIQGAYKRNPDGTFSHLNTNDESFLKALNSQVANDQFQHGGNDDYEVDGHKGRLPGADEHYLAVMPDGSSSEITSTADLRKLYENILGVPWPYP